MSEDWNYLTSFEVPHDQTKPKSAICQSDVDGPLIARRGNTPGLSLSPLSTVDSFRVDPISLPPGVSPSQAGKYFGSAARAKFFDRYQWLHQQHSITHTSKKKALVSLYYENERPDSEDDDDDTSISSVRSKQLSVSSTRSTKSKKSPSGKHFLPKLSSSPDFDNSLKALQSNKVYLPTLEKGSSADQSDSLHDSDDNISETLTSVSMDDFDDSSLGGYDSEGDIEDDLTARSDLVMTGVDFSSPTSPRSKYIASCIREGVNPRASLMLRKKLTKHLKLQHMGIGNKQGIIFSESLTGLPYLETINLSANNLSDLALKALIDSMCSIPTLREVDISCNIIGPKAAISLGNFLGNISCAISKLNLNQADVDDFEAARFVSSLKKCKSLTDVDLANNKLGAAENLNTVMPNLVTGGEALADLLRSSDCNVKSLKLAWNMIRFDGAIDLCGSLSINKSLTYLDLSFNAIGHNGGVALGEAILENHTLKTLLVASNGIDGVACFSLCVGVIENTALAVLNVDGNPIGENLLLFEFLLHPISVASRTSRPYYAAMFCPYTFVSIDAFISWYTFLSMPVSVLCRCPFLLVPFFFAQRHTQCYFFRL